jgi:hypothetical protein
LKQIIRGLGNHVDVEEWLGVTVDAEMTQDRFVWSPPEGWREYIRPDPETKLLRAGQPAPDFSLRSIGTGRVRLSDFRNKIVWLYIWRSG